MTLELEIETNNIIIKQGEYFGYPICCVESFIQYLSGKSKRYNIQWKTAHHEGFVPCFSHAQQIHKGKIKIKDIIQNRICKIDFEYDNYKGDYSMINGY